MASSARTKDGWLLVENHCPICAAAQVCQGLCDGELALFKAALGPACTWSGTNTSWTALGAAPYRIRGTRKGAG